MSSKVQAIQTLVDKLNALQADLKKADDDLKNQGSHVFASDDDEEQILRKIRSDYNYIIKDTELYRKAVPEGLPEDEACRYFLAIAELQRSIDDLKELAAHSEQSAVHVEEQFQMTKNMVAEREQILKDLKAKLEAQTLVSSPASKKKKKTAVSETQASIRATILVRKELKAKLGKLLESIRKHNLENKKNNDKVLPLGSIVQELFDNFFQHGPESYLKIAALSDDVDQKDISWLIENGIAQANPVNKNEIRMISFV